MAPARIVPSLRRRWWILIGLVLLALAAIVPFAARVRALGLRHAAGPSWRFPSTVYSDGVPLVAGRVLPRGHLLDELAAREYREARAPLVAPGTWANLPGGGVEVFLRGFLDDVDPAGVGGPERVRLALDDSLLVRVTRLGGVAGARAPDAAHPPRLEPRLISILLGRDAIRRRWVSLDRVPLTAQQAVIAAEDRRFYFHLGIDLKSDVRALIANLRHRGIREGGSTITQQLARGLFLGQQRTWSRKLAEIPIAFGLEILLGKRRILELYLNMVYWGQLRTGGVAGIQSAAQGYFDTPVESLRVEQAALLAGMIRSPNTIAPFDHPDRALGRRREVLDDMVGARVLPRGAADSLAALPLGLRAGPPPVELYPSYTGYVRQVLEKRLGAPAAETRGLAVFTTMDLAFQQAAEQEIPAGLARIEVARAGPRLEGAFVAIEPGSEAVRAVVGGRDVDPGEFNRATQARRQTGSAIKPIVYAAALSNPAPSFTPASTVPNQRRSFGEGRWSWAPRNDGGAYTSTVTLACALARSINVATANLVEAIGPRTVADFAARFGLGRLKPVMSIGLGTNEVSLLELTDAFAVFADQGLRRGASPLREVVDSEGHPIAQRPDEAVEVVPQPIASLMTGLLQDVVSYGVAYPLRAQYGFDRPVAGKTGTTNQFHDAWFVGFTPYLVAGVWVGYDRPRSLGRQAAHTALPVWAWTMERLVGAYPRSPFASDLEVEYHAIDPWTGALADSGGCPSMRVPFLRGAEPFVLCGAAPDTMFHGGESLDSMYVADTTRTYGEGDEQDETDTTSVPADTVFTR